MKEYLLDMRVDMKPKWAMVKVAPHQLLPELERAVQELYCAKCFAMDTRIDRAALPALRLP